MRQNYSRTTIVLSPIGVVGFVFFLFTKGRAFPTASLNLDVDKTDAFSIAKDFFSDRGGNLKGYQKTNVSGSTQRTIIFLDKALGMQKPHELMKMDLPTWRWKWPWFRSAEIEGFEVWVDNNGKIIFSKHSIAESTFDALLSSSFVWALGHSFYLLFPVYVRGVGLTLVGLLLGWVFINYGLLLILIAHFTSNVILLSMPLLQSSHVDYRVSVIVLALIPLFVGLLSHINDKGSFGKPLNFLLNTKLPS